MPQSLTPITDPAEIERGEKLIAKDIRNEALIDLFGGMRVTTEQAQSFAEPHWLTKYLVIAGHLSVVVAQSGTGKTTMLEHYAGSWAAQGYRVLFFNADISATDAKAAIARAEAAGYWLLLPEIAEVSKLPHEAADGMPLAIRRLQELLRAGHDLSDVVIILDTLKKCASPNDKNQIGPFLKLCRQLTGKGATVICLAHTLKYYNEQGLPVFEGVGDIRSDVDELIYLIPMDRPEGGKLVSTHPDKTRGEFKPISFVLTDEREVIPTEYQDLSELKKVEQSRLEDQIEIDEVVSFLQSGPKNQKEICKHLGISRRQARKLLHTYDGHDWVSQRGFQHNELRYYLPGCQI